jgi:hypothetical protein
MPDDLTSPDGTILVELQANEVKMSHWINSPRVVDVATGDILFSLWGSEYWRWDARAKFEQPSSVTLQMRAYPGDQPGFELRIDCARRSFEIVDGSCPAELRERLEEHLDPA